VIEKEQESSPSWVGQQVNALFSPVLNFLGNGSTENDEEEEEATAVVTDEDVCMPEEEAEETEESKQEENSGTLMLKESVSSADEEDEIPYFMVIRKFQDNVKKILVPLVGDDAAMQHTIAVIAFQQ
jgi:hypothetical protein